MRVGQSRRWSLLEAWANTLVGFSINYVANLLIFPLFGMHISLGANFLLGLLYTLISVVRGYGMRRVFNWIWERSQ